LTLSQVPAWIASTPSDYDFPHSPAARANIWDDSLLPQTVEPELQLQKTPSLKSNVSVQSGKEVQGGKINRVLKKPQSEMQDVGSCFLKRCDSVARRSKAYEASARSKCSN